MQRMWARVCRAQPGALARPDGMPLEKLARRAAAQASSQPAAAVPRKVGARLQPAELAAPRKARVWTRPARARDFLKLRKLMREPLAELRARAPQSARAPRVENGSPN